MSRTTHVTGSFYEEYARPEWAALASTTPHPFTQADVQALAALGDPISPAEADAIYRPLCQLLQLHIAANRELALNRSCFLRTPEDQPVTPFIIGIAGSVAVGKSTTARMLRELLKRWRATPRVALVTTDGFLYPNAELAGRGIAHRKGFPESYNRRALMRFLSRLKSGEANVSAPVYSHTTYDIVPGEAITLHQPDVVIVEGLNVLQPARLRQGHNSAMAVSDFFDFTIYVDARPRDIERWYVDRFLHLKRTAFTDPASYFQKYAQLDDAIATELAHNIWDSINKPNLVDNIAPTRSRANLIIRKAADHHVHQLLLRKI